MMRRLKRSGSAAALISLFALGVSRVSGVPGLPAPASPDYLLTTAPSQVAAEQHMGGPGEVPLAFEFTLPSDIIGGGFPPNLNSGYDSNRSVLQLELPMPSIFTNESVNQSTGAGLLDKPLLCWWFYCPSRGKNGYWRAVVTPLSGPQRELQLAMPMHDRLFAALPYQHVLGVYLVAGQVLKAGERVRFEYTGKLLARSTDWTGHPLVAHFRYRSFVKSPGGPFLPGPWTLLSDDQVQPLTITAQSDAAIVRVTAPLDVQAGVPFKVAIVVTDRFGNPRTITGPLDLSGGVNLTVNFNDEWRRELTAIYPDPGSYRIVGAFPGARSVYHYTRAWPGLLPTQRLLGDVHMHTGDGGARTKFLGSIGPGDHSGLFTQTFDALAYLEQVSGYDFGAISEHAVRWAGYQLPPAVAADSEFEAGGRCLGPTHPEAPELGDWWPYAQRVQRLYGSGIGGSFIAFPAYEWYSHHVTSTTYKLLHRVVLFRDFAPTDDLPLLPTDVTFLPPQCLMRFLTLAGYGPDRALVIPHMMTGSNQNTDWDFSYRESTIAPRSSVEAYQRVGEIFSARNYNQVGVRSVPYYGQDTWTQFEGRDTLPGPWSYRHGWRDVGVHIGVVGSSDNHSQMPGVNDDRAPDGSRYHRHEPAGTMIVMATARDRDGIFDALEARRTYATTGVRVWLDFQAGGSPMGSQIASSDDSLTAAVDLMAGMTIRRVEVWGARVDQRLIPPASRTPYQLLLAATPNTETYAGTLPLANPVKDGGLPEEWLYYVRAFLETPGFDDADPDDAAWSSPIWITWSR